MTSIDASLTPDFKDKEESNCFTPQVSETLSWASVIVLL